MNYIKHYNILIERARNRAIDGYVENHHVIPKCIDKSKMNKETVKLTAREHYVAHQLLIKIYPDVKGLVYATIAMLGSGHSFGRKSSNNKIYEWLRIKNAEAKRGFKHSEKTKNQISIGVKTSETFINAMIATRGRIHSEEEKIKRINSMKTSKKFKEINLGRKWNQETIDKRAKTNSIVQTGIKKTEEHKLALKKASARSETKIKKSNGIKAAFASDPLFKVKRSLQTLTWRAKKSGIPLSLIK